MPSEAAPPVESLDSGPSHTTAPATIRGRPHSGEETSIDVARDPSARLPELGRQWVPDPLGLRQLAGLAMGTIFRAVHSPRLGKLGKLIAYGGPIPQALG